MNPHYLGGTAMNATQNEEGVDYRKIYYHLAGAVETAIRILIDAQQACEDILLEDPIPAEGEASDSGDNA